MPILTIQHVTSYRYRHPVAFGEHRMMLRPRDDGDQRVLVSNINITPRASEISWTQDCFGNHIAIARFERRAEELCFESLIRVDHAPVQFRDRDVAERARTYPLAYTADDEGDLARFVEQEPQGRRLDHWAQRFVREEGATGTHALLTEMTQSIRRNFRHGARHQKGTRTPLQTLELASGACRDLAVLMIAGLRSLGIAARFVSGYMNMADPDDDHITGGNTHAWVQAYVPGPGWVDFDPSSGMTGNQNLVRVAVAQEPREAIPLAGSFFGLANDHLSMNVAIKVVAA